MFTYRSLSLCYLLLQIYPAHFTGITRWECRYSANFSVRQHHKWYDDSPISKHQNVKKLSECIAFCIVSTTCGLCDSTISDMMIHLFQNIRMSKSYQSALLFVLFQQRVGLSIIIQKLSHASWYTVMSIFIMTK